MNIKEEKGITLVALIITVILTIILAVIGLEFGQDAIDKANLEDIKTDMISIKTKAKIIAEQYNFKDIENLIGTQLDEDNEAEGLQVSNIPDELRNIFEETTTNEQEETVTVMDITKLYKWGENDLKSQGLSTIDGNKYIVYYNLDDTNNCDVYYIKGIDGKYSLTELKDI